MDQLGFQTASSVARTQGKNALTLQKGQVFEGKIIKFFPNNTAALRLGSMNVTARLEAPLSAGEEYFFQVQQNDGIPRLQVLQADQAALKSGSADQAETAKVLQALGVMNNKNNQAMLGMFQSEQLPFSKDMVQKGATILQQANAMNGAGARLLATMNQAGLPMTLQTFQSLFQVEHGASLSTQLQNLEAQLQSGNAKTMSQAETSAVANLNRKLSQTMAMTNIESFSKTDTGNKLVQLMQMSQSAHAPQAVKEGAMTLLQKTGLVSENFGSAPWLSSFKEALMQPENRAILQNLLPQTFSAQNGVSVADMEPLELFRTVMNRLTLAEGEAGRQQLQQLLTLFQNADGQSKQVDLSSSALRQAMQMIQSNEGANVTTAQERQALTVLYQGTFTNESANAGGMSTIATQLSKLMQQIGMQHEASIAQQSTTSNQQTSLLSESAQEPLKQTLMQYMNQLPTSVQDTAETLLHRITGQQLLAQEQQGPLQQTAIQVPLALGNYHTDLTVQWEGRSQEDGSLHPDHCRIIFYLEMENLGETVADVQIQNRLVTVNIFNEKEKPDMMMELLQPFLKEKLAEQNYSLSSINWKNTEDETKHHKSVYESYSGFEGVDVRI
ncbi:hypothetical protein D7Z54_21355 [Salibacterium salarium]|uniref:Hook-length control protein FliK n=1 Tax=Salibacterium salarium TaxID=284579 RepID=A0A428MZ48_9BACI|nr:hypothetical protein [Salibacterium salarium]RSL31405.1 hypothetical protein D7Z54_21355 [Salibacterium salarium]